MKFRNFVYFVLKVICYVLAFGGALLALFTIGGSENDTITWSQFWLYEFYAVLSISAAVAVYYIREFLKLR
jgi:hypothetical protein